MQNLLEELKSTLEIDDRLVIDGKLNKNKIVEMALALDEELLTLLLKNDTIKKHFFKEVSGTLIFDKIEFQRFVSNKQFLPDSYTAFKNKIGLTANGEYLTESKEVVLAWPYKDCVLEGGQTKEDQKRKEIFWNATLAPDEIDRLLDPKVLTNIKRYDKDGEHEAKSISINDNLIIKGNNLLSLHSLKKAYSGKVKLVYIDPPYNTGGDGFQYNDSFNHSSWLTFMRSRLEIAQETLSKEGSIWINIDDDESHYLKVLCDEVFGRENFVTNVVWKKKYSPQNDARFFSDMHDHILVYAKRLESLSLNQIPRTAEANKRYKNPDNDKRGPWKSVDFSVKTYSKDYDYPITTPSGRVVEPPKSRAWMTSKERFQEMVNDNRIYFGKKGDAVPSLKRFLTEVQQGTPPQTIWDYSEVGHNQDARKEVIALFKDDLADFSTPKPEKLLQRIIHIGSDENDIVLDFFAGSGTTAAVALKMSRRFIVCEQMEYAQDVTSERVKKVVGKNVPIPKGEAVQTELQVAEENGEYYKFEFDKGGISEDVEWQGGGSFIYAELKQSNATFVEQIEAAKDTGSLWKIWEQMQETGFISYRIQPKTINAEKSSFEELSLKEQKQFLIELLDKNQLYVNYSEIDDETYQVSEEEKKLNREFYRMK